tara:strand:- start:344067 stop:344768 length:702 start_codon:yes stop_codon:yes gene_type:complete
MPLIALISDIHGNLPALEAVLKKVDTYKPDQLLCLGDIVGYGPFPVECVDLIMDRNIPTVMGNHDAGVSGKLTIKHFRGPNRVLIEKTQELLNESQLNWLRELPVTLKGDKWTAVHANPIEPLKWEYVDSAIKARSMLRTIDTQLCFVGHTHIPFMVSDQIAVMGFKKEHKYLINPGSVGQPRDDDFRASFCLLDTDKWEIKTERVDYNTEKVLTGLTILGFSRSESHRLLRY